MNQTKRGGPVMALALAQAMLALACSGAVDLGADANSPQGGSNAGGNAGSGGNASSGGDAGGGTVPSYDPDYDAGATCPAACGDRAGAVQELPTTQDFYSALVGSWQICAGGHGAFGGIPSDVIGVEYAPPQLVQTPYAGTILRGDMYYLVGGPNGPVRGVGFDYQLTYDVSPQDPAEGPPVQLNMHPSPTSGFGGGFLYSACPREWQLSGGSANPAASAILVPLE